MTTTTSSSKTISAALKLVDNKKQNLKKAYDDLQSHSSLLSSFPLSWQNIDSHFTTFHNTLSQRFIHLQSLESQFQQNHNDPSISESKSPNPKAKDAIFSSFHNDPSISDSKLPDPKVKDGKFSSFHNDPSSSSIPTTQIEAVSASISRGEALNVFCKNSDGKGLRNFIGDNLKDRLIIKDEIQIGFKCCSNPAEMVLDSLDGVFGGNGNANAMIDGKEPRLIKSISFLFQQLTIFSPFVSFDVKKKAKRLLNDWKVNLVNDCTEPFWVMAFLQFVAVYGLLTELNTGELAGYCASAAATDKLLELFQIIGLSDRVSGVIQKLIERGKHVLAVKCIFHFKLTDKNPPIPILKAFVNESQQIAKRLAIEGKPLNEIKFREIHALKSVIKVIDSYNLDSEFPRASLEQQIEELHKQRKVSRKTAAQTFAAKPLQQQQISGIKHPQTSAPFSPTPVFDNGSVGSTLHHQYQQPQFQSTSLFPEHPNPYMNMPTVPFGMNAPSSIVPTYTGPSTGPYGHNGVPMAPTGNLNQSVSHPNSSEPQVMPGYYVPGGPSANLNQGGSHQNSSEPRVVSGYYAPMGPGGKLNQGGSNPNPSASGGYGLQHHYGTSYPQ